jgi:Fibronectin type III domain
MKRTLTLLGLSLMLSATVALAQHPMDSANEKAVRIVEGPRIDNITGHSAAIDWTTSSAGANHVRYRVAGSNQPWQSAYHQGGGTHHSLQLTGLEPGRTYEWEILTRDGDLRKAGRFQTPGHGDRDQDRDRDHDRR